MLLTTYPWSGILIGTPTLGSDTTSVAMSATIFYLLHNPRYLMELTNTVRNTFVDSESILPGPRLNELHLLRAVIDESLRLSPPAPTEMPREILSGGQTVDGHELPAGTIVGVPIYAIHHNSAYFRDPFVFKPERWLRALEDGTSGDEELERAQAAFCAFSLGPRGCIGKNMAYVELSVTIAKMLWRYDLRLAPGQERVGADAFGTYALKDMFVTEKDGPVVQFRDRSWS